MKIKVEDNFTRLDKYLIKVLNNAPMSLIQRLIRKKNILVNSNKAKASQELFLDDEITIFYNFKGTSPKTDKKIIINEKKKFLNLIEYENDSFIIINKPPNIAVQGGSKVKISLKDIYESLLDTSLYLVHRIDKDTSGLIILVKNRFVAADFSKLFVNKKINKHYLALTEKKFTKNSSLILNKNNEDKLMRLRYRYLNKFNGSFVYYVSLITGRKHQIRLQFYLSNNPIKYDKKFSEANSNKNLCLYSFSLSFFYKNIFYKFKLPYEKTLNEIDF